MPLGASLRWRNQLHRRGMPAWLKKVNSYLVEKTNVWHVTDQDSDFWPLDGDTPVVLTIHDLNFLRESKSDRKIFKRLSLLQKKIDRASIITTVSQYCANEIQEFLDLKGKPIHVIYNGGVESFINQGHVITSKPFHFLRQPFLFVIGELTSKKNVHSLLPFIEHLPDYHLVLAGKNQTEYGRELLKEIKKRNLQTQVHAVGIIDDQHRAWMYEHCEALLFPTLTEGFGLPVIEAMLYGKPVFLSNCTSLPEVAGELGFYWKHFEPEYMVEVFRKGIAYFKQHPELKKALKQRALSFSWQTAAEKYLSIYRSLL